MVFAVQCPKCRKFMLVEERERGKVVHCLLCRAKIKVGAAAPTPVPAAAPSTAPATAPKEATLQTPPPVRTRRKT